MSLTAEDIELIRQALLPEIRLIVREEIYAATEPRFLKIEADIEAIKNDIKEIYSMLTKRGLRRILDS